MFIKLNYLWPSAYGNAYLERFKKISPHTQMMSVRRKKWPTSERS
nr:MAG TPA: hypothetical protein [Crassvirales sp.]